MTTDCTTCERNQNSKRTLETYLETARRDGNTAQIERWESALAREEARRIRHWNARHAKVTR